MNFNKKEIFTIPNILTYIRIICVPFFIWVVLDKSIPYNIYIAFGLFAFATITDVVDGFVARRFKLVSDIGKVVDPIADKLLQVSTLVCLTVLGKIHWAFPVIFFIKETYMVIGGGIIVKIFKSKYVIQANIFGKLATCLNSLGIVMAFFVGEFENRAYDISVLVILSCGAVFAVVTATAYTIQFVKFRIKELQENKLANPQNVDSEVDVENVEIAENVVVESEISVGNVQEDADNTENIVDVEIVNEDITKDSKAETDND